MISSINAHSLDVNSCPRNGRRFPIVTGIAFSKDWKQTWGYSRANTADDFASRYAHLLSVVRGVPLFAGCCYTQFTDTYQEANGLLYMDRTPKIPVAQIAKATAG